MEKDQIESKLRIFLSRLEESARRIVNTRGYTDEAQKLRVLEELIKEQLKNENTRSTASEIR